MYQYIFVGKSLDEMEKRIKLVNIANEQLRRVKADLDSYIKAVILTLGRDDETEDCVLDRGENKELKLVFTPIDKLTPSRSQMTE